MYCIINDVYAALSQFIRSNIELINKVGFFNEISFKILIISRVK
jgi:hypothetical protein